MTINKNSTEQINVALLDLENKIKRNNQSAVISRLESDIDAINKALNTKQNGLVPGATYDINISGNAATSNHSSTADNATTADSANTATTAGYANNATNADISTVAKGLPFGTCTTAAATVNKEVIVTPSITTLTAGTTIAVKMENTNNASNATLNVNNTGAYLIKRYGNTNAGTSSREAWQGGVIQLFTFDGSYWYLDDFRQNAQYALQAERAYGSGLCNTAANVTDKLAYLYDYTLQAGSTFTLYFNIANTAASALTLNMNSTGAKPIYINGVASSATNYTIPKGTYFVTYNGTYYNVQTNGPHAITADYASTAGSASITFPEGFVYKQYYNPSTSSWEKTPAQMGLQVSSGYKWTEITSDFSSYPYSKIGTTVTGSGHNARHRHGMNHKHRMEHTHLMNHDHYFADWFGSGATTASSNGICMIAASNNRGSTTRATWRSGDYYTSSAAHTGTYYTGNSITTGSASGTDTGRTSTDYDTSDTTFTYPEPNYHGCKLWKVVVDA